MAEAVVTIAMRAQTAALKRGFRDTQKQLTGLQKTVRNVGFAFRTSFTEIRSAALIARSGFMALVSAIQELDQIAKTARAFNITAGELRAFNLEGEKAGGTAAGLTRIMADFQRRMGEASNRTGEAFEHLERMGLSAERLAEMPLLDAMRLVSNEINELGNESLRADARQDIFGRGARDNILVLRDLDRILKDVNRRADSLDFDTEGVEKANDTLREAGEVWTSWKVRAVQGVEAVGKNLKVFARETGLENLFPPGNIRTAAGGLGKIADELHRAAEAAKELGPIADIEGIVRTAFQRSPGQISSMDLMTDALERARAAAEPLGNIAPTTFRQGGTAALRRGRDQQQRQINLLDRIRQIQEQLLQIQIGRGEVGFGVVAGFGGGL